MYWKTREWICLLLLLMPSVLTKDNITLQITDFTSSYVKLSCKYESDTNETDAFFNVYKGKKTCIFRNIEMCRTERQNHCNIDCLTTEDAKTLPFLVNLGGTCEEVINIKCKVSNTNTEHVIDLKESLQLTSQSDPPEIFIHGGLPVEASCKRIQIACTVKNACQKTKLDIAGAIPMEPPSVTHTTEGRRFTTRAISEAIFSQAGNYTITCKESGKSDVFARYVTLEVTGSTNQTEGDERSCHVASQQHTNGSSTITILSIVVTLLCTLGGVVSIIFIARNRIMKRRLLIRTSEDLPMLQEYDRYKTVEREIEQLTVENISHKAPEILSILEEGDIKYDEECLPLIHQLAERTEDLFKRPHFGVLFTVLYRNCHKSAVAGKDYLTEIIWKQLKSYSIESEEQKEEYIQKLENFTHLDVDLCSRLLWRYAMHGGMKCNLYFVDVLTFLVKEGADPFALNDGINAFTLVLKKLSLKHLQVQDTLKSSVSSFFQQVFHSKSESLLNDVIKSIPSDWFGENSSNFSGIQALLEEKYYEDHELKHNLLNHQDTKKRTPLHNLMHKVFTDGAEETISNDKLWKFIKTLITKKNFDFKDMNKVTPYFWICSEIELLKDLKKESEVTDLIGFLNDICDDFKRKHASRNGADLGMRIVREIKMECLLKRIMVSDKAVEFLLKEGTTGKFFNALNREVEALSKTIKDLISKGCVKYLKYLPDTVEFKTFTRKHAEIMNRKMLVISSSVLEVLIDKCNVQSILDAFMKHERTYHIYYPTWLTMIEKCIKKGAVPKKNDIENLITTKIFKVEESLLATIQTIEQLVKAYRMQSNSEPIEIYLNLMQNQYQVSAELRNVAGEVIRDAYVKLSKCRKSKSVINLLLFLRTDDHVNTMRTCFLEANTILQESQIVNDSVEEEHQNKGEKEKNPISEFVKRNNNLFQRSILHLAAIFCHDKQVLSCIPYELVKEWANQKDIHGCTPLHIAYLHENEAAIDLLNSFQAEVVPDKFGRNPKSLGISDANIVRENEKYKESCQDILTMKSSVFENMKGMLVLSAKDSQSLEKEFIQLFNKVVEKDREIPFAQVQIGGSMREKLKVGRIDELDLQIFTSSRRLFMKTFARQEIHDYLVKKISKFSQDGNQLRLTAVGNPWKFIWEKRSPQGDTSSCEIAVDVQLFSEEYLSPTVPERLKELLEDAPARRGRVYLKLNEFGKPSSLNNTMCHYEWDILDSLPPGCRMGILIAKVLLEALEITSNLPERVITAQVIKTTAFWLIAGQMPAKIDKKHADVIIEKWATPAKLRLEYEGNFSNWTTEEDLNNYGEEGREWAVRIFETIHYIAKYCGVLLDSFLLSQSQELYVLEPWQLYEAIDTCDKCQERLKETVFFT